SIWPWLAPSPSINWAGSPGASRTSVNVMRPITIRTGTTRTPRLATKRAMDEEVLAIAVTPISSAQDAVQWLFGFHVRPRWPIELHRRDVEIIRAGIE